MKPPIPLPPGFRRFCWQREPLWSRQLIALQTDLVAQGKMPPPGQRRLLTPKRLTTTRKFYWRDKNGNGWVALASPSSDDKGRPAIQVEMLERYSHDRGAPQSLPAYLGKILPLSDDPPDWW